jgi:glucose/arabinose dehydrogenase
MRKIWSLRTLSILLLLGYFHISPAAGAKPWPNITLNQVVTGLNLPMFITHAGDHSGRLFILERTGTVRIFKDGALLPDAFLDISSKVGIMIDGGLQCMAFPPGFKRKQYFYVYYTNLDGNPVLSRFQVSANPDLADAGSEEQLLTFTSSFPGLHPGGWIGFHPRNHYLYISTGDTGPQEDPNNNSQNPAVLKGKILRIDVEHGPGTSQPYRIPRKNPFVSNPDYRPEIWALGLRNPFRCSFNKGGSLYIGDVGYGTAEEINFERSNSAGGHNYGWNILEGPNFTGFNGNALPPNYQAPVAYFYHPTMSAIIGGYVYQGSKFQRMRGVYFFGNFGVYGAEEGQIWGMRKSDNWATTPLLHTDFRISSFGEDQKGNLYVADIFNGIIYQIVDTKP